VYQREAQPITLPFYPGRDVTKINETLRLNSALGDLMLQTVELAVQWRSRQLALAQQAEADARKKAAELSEAARKFGPAQRQVAATLR
jgi:hypothetical protein